MKNKVLTIALAAILSIGTSLALVPTHINCESYYPEVQNTAFKAGEKLTYKVHYGIIDAGKAELELRPSPFTFDDREAFHAVGTGKSLGAFDLFFKVRDHYETYIDKEGVFPWYFKRRVDEGGYKINQDYTFDHSAGTVSTEKEETHEIPIGAQDMISAFYYARTLDFSGAKVGDIFEIPTFLDDELYILKIKYKGKDEVRIRKGKYKALKFVPVVQKGRIWKDEEDLSVWVSDDGNKVPLLVKTKVLVGSIKMELTDYKGLAHPIAKI